jgi:hypothetical protein
MDTFSRLNLSGVRPRKQNIVRQSDTSINSIEVTYNQITLQLRGGDLTVKLADVIISLQHGVTAVVCGLL